MKNGIVKGQKEFKEMLRKLAANGVSAYKISKLLSIPNPWVNQLLKDDNKYPTLSNFKIFENLGYKVAIVITKDPNKFAEFVDETQKSLNELYDLVITKAAEKTQRKRRKKNEDKDEVEKGNKISVDDNIEPTQQEINPFENVEQKVAAPGNVDDLML